MTAAELDARLGGGLPPALLKLAITGGFKGAAPDSPTVAAWLDPAIADALRLVGLPPAASSGVTDADLAAIPAASLARFLDIVAWKVRVRLLDAVALCDMKQGPQEQKLSQLVAPLEAGLARMEKALAAKYPDLFGVTLSAGRIRLGTSAGRYCRRPEV